MKNNEFFTSFKMKHILSTNSPYSSVVCKTSKFLSNMVDRELNCSLSHREEDWFLEIMISALDMLFSLLWLNRQTSNALTI